MKFSKHEKIDLLAILISAISLIASFILSIDYLSWIAVILCGIPIFRECAEGLITEFDIKADLLVSIAIVASIIIGELFAAGEIATIMAIGGFLEEYTVSKTQGRIKELANMTPQVAVRIRNGKEERILASEVQIGDILKVLPGESIPTDGRIINGETSIDQSTLTGESIPVDKKANDDVYSGTINLYGSFTMETKKVSDDSSLQKLIKLVESSSPENANVVRQADKWATFVVAIAFTAAILTYLYTFEIARSVTILVVFCPCALVLATPTAIMAAIGNLTKYGILVKDGASIEELARTDELVFDKTGTLTYGTPEVVDIISNNPKKMMRMLASLESKSEHPIAKAIVKYYDNAEELLNIDLKDYKSESSDITIFVAENGRLIGNVLLADTLRENSKETIRNLKKLRIKTTLLTGDNEKTARHIAKEVKVRNVKFNCLPEDKTNYIRGEQMLGHNIAMIGDGVNDAPSLKKANVGIAMGKIGSEISVEAANITLINDNVGDIPHLIGIARKTVRTINISIAFALTSNVVAMALAILGILNPIEGALIHNIGSVAVITYSSTLIKYRMSKRDYKQSKKVAISKKINMAMN